MSLCLLCGKRVWDKLLLLGCYCALVGAVVTVNGENPNREAVIFLLWSG